MKLLGFNFTKISAEKTSNNFQDLKVGTKIDVTEIIEAKQDIIKTKEELLAVKFTYDIEYSKDIAKMMFQGNLLLGIDSKTFKEVLKQWKGKQMPEEFKITLFNIIIRKSSIKALNLEEELNLPLHIQLPSLRKKE